MILKPCWKCGNNGIFVNKHGTFSRIRASRVSCIWDTCMSKNESYSVQEWQEHDRTDMPERKSPWD